MVLTHRDFGRAYLTEEDGWARRFLVSLFANHTVLFVGYSHSDTIMTYLTPSLLPDGKGRFALVGSESDDHDRWRRMGVKPVIFPQGNKYDFASLDTGVKGLADFERRGFLGWQQEVARIAEGEPPHPTIDAEARDVINHALTREELTSFFVNAAKSPSWINWLDQYGHLKRFFSEGSLQEHDVVLARWSVLPLKGEISNQFLSVISDYHERLNYRLWKEFVLELGYAKDEPLDSKTLSRWIHILMNCIPIQSADEHYSLLGIAEHCANAGEIQCLLQVYDAVTANLVRFLSNEHQGIDDSWCALWGRLSEKCLPQTAHTLLERTTMRLEQRHSARLAWNQGDHKTDRDSELRSAIEPHEQDQHLCRIYLLIDVARDCLEWLATHDRIAARSWCDRFAKADAPLLRRLAIHAIDARFPRQDLSANDKVAWLLERCDVNETGARHEIFRMARNTYQELSRQKREALIQAISNYELPEDISTYRNERLAYHRFNWFCWLQSTDPNCELLTQELDKIRVQYPEFQPRQHPDLPHGWLVGSTTQSPWSVEKLLTKPASKWLSSLLNYQPSQEEQIQSMQSRHSLLLEVSEAAKRDTFWGLGLADAMSAKSEWKSDLWSPLISAWETVNLDQDSMEQILSHLSNSELYEKNAKEISDFLNKLIQHTDTVNVMQRLDKLHNIATALHPYTQQPQVPQILTLSDQTPQHMLSWLTDAINHPSGKLAEFWIHSIAHWCRQQEAPPQELSPEYRCALSTIIEDNGIPGKLGRTILASQLHFLHSVDSAWAEQHLPPLFEAGHEDFACAWDGFLTWGRLCPQTAELLQSKLIDALQRGIQEFERDKFSRFINFYIFTLVYFVTNKSVRDHWVRKFFQEANGNPKVKCEFAVQIRYILRDLDQSQQQEWWNVWLKDYWKNRLQGVPCRLENGEIAEMLKWVIHLQGGVFRSCRHGSENGTSDPGKSFNAFIPD